MLPMVTPVICDLESFVGSEAASVGDDVGVVTASVEPGVLVEDERLVANVSWLVSVMRPVEVFVRVAAPAGNVMTPPVGARARVAVMTPWVGLMARGTLSQI